ncbi:VG15 protein [Mycobacterium sp. NPDC004974]
MATTAPPELADFQAGNALLVTAATTQLADQLGGLDWAADNIQSAVTRIYSATVRGFRSASSTLGIQMYGDIRGQAEVRGGWQKVLAPDPDAGWLETKVADAFKVPAPAEETLDITGVFDVENVVTGRLANSTQRMVLSGSRETVELTAAGDDAELLRWPDKPPAPVGPAATASYIRVPASEKPCAFCAMLAAKPYNTKESASVVVGRGKKLSASAARYRAGQSGQMGMSTKGKGWRYISGGTTARGKRALGETYHDHCKCIAVPVWSNAVMPLDTDRIDGFAAMYEKAAADAGTYRDAKKILASMRQIYGLR